MYKSKGAVLTAQRLVPRDLTGKRTKASWNRFHLPGVYGVVGASGTADGRKGVGRVCLSNLSGVKYFLWEDRWRLKGWVEAEMLWK